MYALASASCTGGHPNAKGGNDVRIERGRPFLTSFYHSPLVPNLRGPGVPLAAVMEPSQDPAQVRTLLLFGFSSPRSQGLVGLPK